MANFWDRCRTVGRAGDKYLWECPKDRSTDTLEMDCLFEGLEAIEAPHTIWILTDTPLPRFAKPFREALDRIADEVLED